MHNALAAARFSGSFHPPQRLPTNTWHWSPLAQRSRNSLSGAIFWVCGKPLILSNDFWSSLTINLCISSVILRVAIRWLANVMSQSRGVSRSDVCDMCIIRYMNMYPWIPRISPKCSFQIIFLLRRLKLHVLSLPDSRMVVEHICPKTHLRVYPSPELFMKTLF